MQILYYLRAIIGFFLPHGLVFASVFAISLNDPIPQTWTENLVVLPPSFLIVLLLLGLRFNRSRPPFAYLVCLFYFGLYYWGASRIEAELLPHLFDAVQLLLPINILVIYFLKERGFFTLRGLVRLLCIVSQVPLVYFSAVHVPGIYALWDTPHLSFDSPVGAFAFSYTAGLFWIVTTGVLLVGVIKRRSAIESGLLWGLLTIGTSVLSDSSVLSPWLCCIATGLIFILSILESSWGMAFRDDLTGLPARRAMNEALLKLGNTYTIAMVDIDFFKKFNDRHGHDVGDQVLRMVAAQLARVTGGGKAFRYGGEEFTLLFNGTSLKEALPHLERVRKQVKAAGFVVRTGSRKGSSQKSAKKRKRLSVAVSIGVAERTDSERHPRDVIKMADKKLYKAKKQGRNRVCS